jgi:diguanylate cyclase (GGDEF)-like protein
MFLPPGERAHPRAQLLFTLSIAVLGWGALALAMIGDPSSGSVAAGPWLFVLFLVVILATRTMAFHLVPENVLSLDAGIYAVAAMCLGPVPGGVLVALALTADAAWRVLARRRVPGAAGHGRDEVGYVLYFGGMTGALVMGCAWLAGADPEALTGEGQLVLAVRVLGLGAVLLGAHYAIQGIRSILSGRTWRSYLRAVALPGIASEASLLPAAVVMVLVYRPDERLAFGLVCATYVLVNFVFNRLSSATGALRRRVRELEILDTTARRLAASLQLPELVETVARETVRAIPEAEVVALIHGGGERCGERLVVDAYDRCLDRFARLTVGRDEGATGWVVREQAALVIDELARAEVDVGASAAAGMQSWLGVPIFLYGGCEGVLSIQSRRAGAFDDEQRRLLESIALQVAAALQNAHLYEMAMVDGLTGLFVRRYFDARLDEEIERARRYGADFSMVMMDVDDFKALNDTHGHQVGDRVLRAIAAIVRANMRGVDTAARYGGEELALILPRTGLVSAYNQAERIRAAIAEHRLALDDGTVIGVTASFGIAGFPESGADAAHALVKRADRALYRAKQTGKNRVELFWADESGPAHRPVASRPPDDPPIRSAADAPGAVAS